MPSFNSLYTVRSGLFAQRRALETVGHNISNASTVGHTRQEVAFSAAAPAKVINSAGRGVEDVNIIRYRDEFLDRQFRGRNSAVGYNDTLHRQLSQVEHVIGDLSEGGMRTSLDEFFNAWQNLSLRPSDTSARIIVASSAEEMLSQAQITYAELTSTRENLDEAIRIKASEINTATEQLAEINRMLRSSGNGGDAQSHELRDRRDMLIDSLTHMAGVTSVSHNDGTTTVYLGSLPLVDKEFAYTVDATTVVEADLDADPALTSIQQFVTSLTWNGTSNQAKFSSGEIGALVELRDQGVPSYMKFLDNLVRTVATEVNNLHNNGVPVADQIDVFEITSDWMSIRLNPLIKDDPNLIHAGTGVDNLGVFEVAPGDGERARAIAGIRNMSIMTGDPVGTRTVTPGEYLRAVSSLIGVQVQMAGQRVDAATLQMEQAEQLRQSASGVSLDDEMTKMIQYQQAYNAAARIMTSIDEMLDVVINRLGLVGR